MDTNQDTIRLYSSRGALIGHLDPKLFKSFKCSICGEHAFQEIKTSHTCHVVDADSDHIAREC